MIDFKTYLKVIKLIADELTKDSLGLQRRSMPQIIDQEDFKQFLRKSNISFSKNTIFSHKLKPTQKHLNPEKIIKLLKSSKSDTKPIIISSDNYVIDGHHRWAVSVIKNEPIVCLVVNRNAKNLLEVILDDYENIIKKSL